MVWVKLVQNAWQREKTRKYTLKAINYERKKNRKNIGIHTRNTDRLYYIVKNRKVFTIISVYSFASFYFSFENLLTIIVIM